MAVFGKYYLYCFFIIGDIVTGFILLWLLKSEIQLTIKTRFNDNTGSSNLKQIKYAHAMWIFGILTLLCYLLTVINDLTSYVTLIAIGNNDKRTYISRICAYSTYYLAKSKSFSFS